MIILEYYFLWFMIYSIVGWIYETTICSIEQKELVNRGFLNGPYCPIYGFGAIIILLCLGKLENPLIIFLLGALLTCTLEYFTSWLMEKLFNARWWDYSDKKLNINGRVCLLGAIVFGSFAVILIKYLHPLVYNYSMMLELFVLHVIFYSLIIIFTIDIIYTITKFSGFQYKLKTFSEELSNYKTTAMHIVADYKENILDKKNLLEKGLHQQLKKGYDKIPKINFQERRMILSFPRFKSLYYDKALKEIKNYVITKRNNKHKKH